MEKFKFVMDEFNYIKNAYQYYIGFLINIATFLTVSYKSPAYTVAFLFLLYLIARSIGQWHFKSQSSGFNRQNYMIGKYSPPWQTLFKVLWMLAEDKPEARKELEEWL